MTNYVYVEQINVNISTRCLYTIKKTKIARKIGIQ